MYSHKCDHIVLTKLYSHLSLHELTTCDVYQQRDLPVKERKKMVSQFNKDYNFK